MVKSNSQKCTSSQIKYFGILILNYFENEVANEVT